MGIYERIKRRINDEAALYKIIEAEAGDKGYVDLDNDALAARLVSSPRMVGSMIARLGKEKEIIVDISKYGRKLWLPAEWKKAWG